MSPLAANMDSIKSRAATASGARGHIAASVINVPKTPDALATHGLGEHLDDLGPQEQGVRVPEGQRRAALDNLRSRAICSGDPVPARLKRHLLPEAAGASNELGQGKVEAQVVLRVLVEGHIPNSTRDVEVVEEMGAKFLHEVH